MLVRCKPSAASSSVREYRMGVQRGLSLMPVDVDVEVTTRRRPDEDDLEIDLTVWVLAQSPSHMM